MTLPVQPTCQPPAPLREDAVEDDFRETEYLRHCPQALLGAEELRKKFMACSVVVPVHRWPDVVEGILSLDVVIPLERIAGKVLKSAVRKGRRGTRTQFTPADQEMVACEAMCLLRVPGMVPKNKHGKSKLDPFDPERHVTLLKYLERAVWVVVTEQRDRDTARPTIHIVNPEDPDGPSIKVRTRVDKYTQIQNGNVIPDRVVSRRRDYRVDALQEIIERGPWNELEMAILARHIFGGTSQSELAEELGIDIGTVYQAKSRLIRRLRVLLSDAIGG